MAMLNAQLMEFEYLRSVPMAGIELTINLLNGRLELANSKKEISKEDYVRVNLELDKIKGQQRRLFPSYF